MVELFRPKDHDLLMLFANQVKYMCVYSRKGVGMDVFGVKGRG